MTERYRLPYQFPFLTRIATPDDYHFVHKTWLLQTREAEPNRYIDWETFRQHQDETIRHRVSTATVWIVCHLDDPTEIIGFVCFSRPMAPPTAHDVAMSVTMSVAIHCLYIKPLFRRRGIARQLINSLAPHGPVGPNPIVVTQYFKLYPSLTNHFNLTFNPYQ